MSPTTEPTPSISKPELLRKIGQVLEERRKVRGLTFERISQTLRIRGVFLKAIELGEWKDLPGEVYARGFITRYAQHLGLDPTEILAPYYEYLKTADKNAPVSERPVTPTSFPKGGYVWAGLGILVLIGLFKFMATDQGGVKKTSPAATPVHTEAQTTPVSAATALPVQKSASHQLEVYSPFPLWLSVKAESRSFEGFLPQGSTWSWKAEGIFSIRLGHTQQVTLSFDGKPVTLGENQKRVSLPGEN